ncbi:MAG TPA: cation diffusion facilitator family transporter [Methylophilaceae bacterium]|nr:cation diffusion facilitator family transporter [Methylophilaceae bacterium]
MASAPHSKLVIYVATASNLAIAVVKFITAGMTGSSAMLSEGIHSVIDTANQLLLLLGVNRGQKPADARHPYGYGKELYFWSLIVAMVLFGIGGGMAIYEGITHLINPRPIEDPFWAYVVLGVSAVLEGTSLSFALRQMLAKKGKFTLWQSIRRSYDPSSFTVLFEDSAAMVGLAAAFLGVYFGQKFGNPYFDGAASIVIGITLCVVALLLIRESKGLLVGEAAKPEVVASITELTCNEPAVIEVGRVLTMVFGPDEILLNIEAKFIPELSMAQLTAIVSKLEQAIQQRHPQVKSIFIDSTSMSQADHATRHP